MSAIRPVLLLVMAATGFVLRGVSALPPSEEDLRAAYIVNILRLADRHPPGTGTELVLCTVAGGGVEKALRALEGTSIRGRKLAVRNVPRGDPAGCEAIFFGKSPGSESVLARAQAMGLLTLGNDADFVPLSGMVALVIENRRLAIVLNRQVLKSTAWTFSSHLLEIARIGSGETP